MGLKKLMIVIILGAFAPTLNAAISNMLTLAPSADEISLFVNSSFIIFCRSDNKDIKIQWLAPMGIIIDNIKGRVHIEENTGQLALVFEHIASIDKGTWSCRTTGNEDIYQKSFELLVNQKISFEDTETVLYVKENRDVTISCKVWGDPKPTISWYRNGDPIKFPSLKYKQLSDGLFIKAAIQSDDGEYTCRAFQISPTITDVQEKNILLRIQQKPVWVNNQTVGVYYAYINGYVNITCEAIAEPPASFTWIYLNKAITHSTKPDYRIFRDDYISVLQIHVTDENQFGEYKCKVANSLGTLERTFQLKKGQKPVAPSKFQLWRSHPNAFELDIRSIRYTDIPDNMNIMGYRVEYMSENQFKYAAGNWSYAGRKDFPYSRGSRFVIQGLERNTTYYVRAACKNLAGLSDWTKIVMLKTSKNNARKSIEFAITFPIILSIILYATKRETL